ncbi:MAG: M23 family metallopeptidase [Saprospiraceae bacterium]|nr:M23 family metallopeptidase [Bacteroidia bacterium]NNL92740.1 M23 family metallopeptidase [Saprospiraceae bacterium]
MTKFIRPFILIIICFLHYDSDCRDTLEFRSPVDHDVRLTGNFMEIRTNHFHTGIDIKSSKGLVGDNIRSVADGFVSRIKVQSGSYGQALYIDHPNGQTSVYAHLNNYSPEIEDYIKNIQYKLETFAVDIYIPDSTLMVKKGQLIGAMGNTGRSFGPHLHFEIRETESEKPLNPELLGFGPSDSKAPILEKLYAYTLGVNNEILKTDIISLEKHGSKYVIHPPLNLNSGKVAFGIQAYDQMNGSYNKNGIYNIKMLVNGKSYYEWTADKYSFSESKKINGFIDYKKRITTGEKVYRLFEPYCSVLENVRTYEHGIVNFSENEAQNIEILATDIYQNIGRLEFEVKSENKTSKPKNNFYNCDTSFVLIKDNFKIEFPPKSLFDVEELKIKSGVSKIENQECNYVTIGSSQFAVSKYFKISMKIPDDYNSNWTFTTTDKRNRLLSFGADTINGRMYTLVDQLGKFYAFKDDEAPKLQVINLESNKKRPWKVKITDNVIPDGKASDLYYYASVNGAWICMLYDLKNDLLVFDDFDRLPKGPLTFELIVSDGQGNISSLRRHIKG